MWTVQCGKMYYFYHPYEINTSCPLPVVPNFCTGDLLPVIVVADRGEVCECVHICMCVCAFCAGAHMKILARPPIMEGK